jgi:hypothetical protein
VKKEILTHLSYLFVFTVIVVLLKGWIKLDLDNAKIVGLFILGGLLGTALPDIDHLIYVYLLRPQDLTSQRVDYLMAKHQVWQMFELMASTREERKQLIFHTAHFQIIFWILSFLVISSTGSIFGAGLVLAFSLHLLVDQLLDLLKLDHLTNWFRAVNIEMEKEKYMFYWIGNLIVLFVLTFVI